MIIDDKHADLIAKALFAYSNSCLEEIDEIKRDPQIAHEMYDMEADELQRRLNNELKVADELHGVFSKVANKNIDWTKINADLSARGIGPVTVSSDGTAILPKELKEKINSLA